MQYLDAIVGVVVSGVQLLPWLAVRLVVVLWVHS